jgi:hypothetical protein
VPATVADDVATERRRFVATLRAVGADAPTLAGEWRAADLARHVVAQDRLRGLPVCAAREFVVCTGLRLTEPYLRSARLTRLLSGRPRSWEWVLARLDRPPPEALVRPRIAPIALWEHDVHHEDVRRPNARPRDAVPDLSPCVWLSGRHQAARLEVRGDDEMTRGVRARLAV